MPYGSPRRFGNRPRFNQRFSRSPRNRFNDEKIDRRAYVRKALPVVPEEAYVPTHIFSEFPIDPKILKNIEQKGYKNPTPVQDMAITPICEGKDVVAIANTGTGKTATFLLPILTKLMKDKTQKALILVPTRELAAQVEEEFMIFSRGLNIYSLLVIGGNNIVGQIRGLQRNPQIVIATPGRIKDLIKRKAINLFQFRTVVLDEVDRMVDIGFLPDVRFIVGELAKPRQSLFFSATITPEIQSVIKTFAADPVIVTVKKSETSHTIDQDVVYCDTGRDKPGKLFDLADNREYQKILVFVRTKRGADQLTRDLIQERFRATAIHGNKAQNARMRALADFKNGRIQVLVATDVAARGIDIPDVNLVVNYDEPGTYADYVHRIGRTGRAGKMGKALTFVIGR